MAELVNNMGQMAESDSLFSALFPLPAPEFKESGQTESAKLAPLAIVNTGGSARNRNTQSSALRIITNHMV